MIWNKFSFNQIIRNWSEFLDENKETPTKFSGFYASFHTSGFQFTSEFLNTSATIDQFKKWIIMIRYIFCQKIAFNWEIIDFSSNQSSCFDNKDDFIYEPKHENHKHLFLQFSNCIDLAITCRWFQKFERKKICVNIEQRSSSHQETPEKQYSLMCKYF